MAKTTPAIDHILFPRLIDRIYHYAERDALVALRGASKKHRARADEALMHHLEIDVRRKRQVDSPLKADLWSPCTVYLSTAGGRRIPALMSFKPTQHDPKQWTSPQLRNLLKHVRVLDCRDEYMQTLRWNEYSKLMPDVHTIRTMCGYDNEVTMDYVCATSVVAKAHVQFTGISRSALIRAGNGPATGSISFDSIPQGVRRAVVNVAIDMRDPFLILYINNESPTAWIPRSLREMVIIFTPIQGPWPKRTRGYQIPSITLHAFGNLAKAMVTQAQTLKITLVGALDMHHEFFGFEDPYDTKEELKETLVEGMQYICYDQLDRSKYNVKKVAAAIKKNIEWIDHNEYKARTRPDLYRLETVRSLPRV